MGLAVGCEGNIQQHSPDRAAFALWAHAVLSVECNYCMYVCTHVCMYVCMYVRTYVCLYIKIWICHQYVGSTNSIFNVTVDIGVPEVTCQFLNGPVTSATCTIRYGTDSTYVNLPNTDSSNGTNVDNVTIPLNALFQSGTLYYYVASSMGVRLQGNFQTGEYNYITIAIHVMGAV